MSFSKNIIETKLAPEAVGTYSQGVEYNGVYYFSGQIGIDPETSILHDDFDDQLNQILQNIDGLLKSCSLTREHIIKTSIFLTDLEKFQHVNLAYEEFFSKPYPARSCIQAAALPKGATIEIEVMAAKG